MKYIPRIAAAVVIAAIVAVAAMLLVPNRSGGSALWADVQAHIRQAHSLTYESDINGKGMPPMHMRVMILESGRTRMEVSATGTEKYTGVTITDFQQQKIVSLIPAQKKAVVIDLTGMPPEIREKQAEHDALAGIKKMIEEAETDLGEKTLNGRKVHGYQVQKGHQQFTIWADAHTGEPVEMTMTMFQGEVETTQYNFVLDAPLDESLFSLDIPQGYTVQQQQVDIKGASVDDVITLLDFWTAIRGGTFPDALTPSSLMEDIKEISKSGRKLPELPKEQNLQMTTAMTRAWMLISQHGEACYDGQGVELGDAETAVFWYKPDGSSTYKVIYGDLHVEDVAEEDMPPRPQQGDSGPPSAAD